ncbi:hypothetical protein [Pseudomonas sp. NGC7]|uniref:hypothetical protein n=1 Tax=Pseudomonas sp. NGC7 TaxID=3341775 RepID=UPI00399D08DA
MDNKTIRWLTSLLIGLATGFMVTGVATLSLLDNTKPMVIVAAATMSVSSVFLIAISYVIAVQEVEK